jgi:hypothetical protein
MNHGCRRRKIQTNGIDNLFNRITAENFPELKKGVTQVYETYRTPNSQNQKNQKKPRNIIIKTLSTKNKERILRAAKETRQVIHKGKPIRKTSDFSPQTLNSRRSWKDIIKAQKESNSQPRIVYPAKLSFLIEG